MQEVGAGSGEALYRARFVADTRVSCGPPGEWSEAMSAYLNKCASSVVKDDKKSGGTSGGGGGAYVPPNQRGANNNSVASQMRKEGGEQKARVATDVAGNSGKGKNAKKNSSGVAKQEEAPQAPADAAAPVVDDALAFDVASLSAEEKQKKAKSLNKKLQQITKLKEKDSSELDADQLKKLESEAAIVAKLAELAV